MSNATDLAPLTPKERVGGFLLWLLMAAVFGSAGWWFGIRPLVNAVGNWNLASDYQTVEARVIERKGQDDGGMFNWYTARYVVAGQTYETGRLTVLDDQAIDQPANAAVLKTLSAAYLQQKPVAIWVSPRKPDVALVTRDLPLQSLWPRLPFALVFGTFALAGALGAVGAVGGFSYVQKMISAGGLWLFSALWCGLIFPFFMMVTSSANIEWIPVVFVGLFALIGALMLWGAVAASITGVGGTTISGLSTVSSAKKSPLGKNQLATSWGKKGKPVKGNVKRGGVGGRGADFDRD